jgi:ubiquinone/menaquinone biosynthesis C-methylase UbiE
MMKKIVKQFIPPIFMSAYRKICSRTKAAGVLRGKDSSEQELGVYWTEEIAAQLEEWGKDHTWNEIECLLVNCKGRVLDIACGTGVNILSMQRFTDLDIYGFDVSDFLIAKAIEKGIRPEKLQVEDATNTSYRDGQFDYSYSIGSLEHFTVEGIELFLKECSRYTSKVSFHMVPIAESDKDEGWIRTNQSFHNNSVAWWLDRYNRHFKRVYVIGSGYKDPGLSVGKWFVCSN